MAGVSIPAALRQMLESRERDLLEHPDPDETVAYIVQDTLQLMADQTGLDVDTLLANRAIADALGGPDYVQATLDARLMCRVEN